MPESYFLGANSHRGFYSLYSSFAAGAGDMLHIIKGGPGTGKSGFMRAMAAAAEGRGLRVERLLCSGDPDSLDGVYVPEMGQGWVDGTAPHVTEPVLFGVSADYIDLGRFCRLPPEPDRAERIAQINRGCKEQYRRAYSAFAAAEALREAAPQLWDMDRAEAVKKRLRGLVLRYGVPAKTGKGSIRPLFMSALSCKGRLMLSSEVLKSCSRVYIIDDDYSTASRLLDYAAGEAAAAGQRVTLCKNPLNPQQSEALLLEDGGLGIFNSSWELEGRCLRLDSMAVQGQDRELRKQARTAARLAAGALELGLERLSEAKSLHDRLEAEYKPLMDFEALTDFTRREAKRLFG